MRARSTGGTVVSGAWLAIVSIVGCRSRASQPMPAEGGVPESLDGPSSMVPARCRRADPSFVLGDGRGRPDVEVGDALGSSNAVAVGFLRRTAVGRTAAVALLQGNPLAVSRIVNLGPTPSDAPPPRLGWRPSGFVAAAYVGQEIQAPAVGAASSLPDGTMRKLGLYAIEDNSRPSAPLMISQRRDDSLALDLAFAGSTGLVVWDEATAAPRGVVKGVIVGSDRPAVPRDLSPPQSDAELPRVVVEGMGFRVVWIARSPEPVSEASVIETTGEPRAFGWLEAVEVDARGDPSGPVRRLTPAGGHISAFDVALPSGRDSSGLALVARDDGEAVDGSGGTMIRVHMRGDVVDALATYPAEGVGRGAPSFVPRVPSQGGPPAIALLWMGNDEIPRWLPLDATGVPTARPSAEDGFKNARPLLFLGDSSDGGARVLVATPSDDDAQMRAFLCAN